MRMSNSISFKALLLTWGIGALGSIPFMAFADTYPSRTIKIVVPFAAGGGGDFVARSFVDKFSETLKQPVVIENKGGGNTVVGTEIVSKAPPDGYTIGLVSTSFSTNPTLMAQMPYRTPEDFAPISLVITYPFGLAAKLGLEANTVQEIIAYAKKNPSRLSIATSGDGSGSHLAALMFQEALGSDVVMVTYRGAGPAINDVAAGHVDLLFTGMSQIKPLSDAKRLKIIASSGLNRIQSQPQTKTISEQGIKGFNAVVWWGMLAPPGTPKDIVDKLNSTFNAIFQDPEFHKKWDAIGTPVVGGTAAQFGELIRKETVRLGKVVKDSGATVD